MKNIIFFYCLFCSYRIERNRPFNFVKVTGNYVPDFWLPRVPPKEPVMLGAAAGRGLIEGKPPGRGAGDRSKTYLRAPGGPRYILS